MEPGSFVASWFACAATLFAGGNFGGAALHFGEFDEPALVEVDEAAPFGVGGVDLAVQPASSALSSSSSGIGVCSVTACSPASSCRLGDRGADVVEHERVERVGADVAFGTAAGFAAARSGRGCGSSSSGASSRCGRASCDSCAHAANTAFDKSFEQPGAGFGAARAPLGVVGGDSAGGLEQLIGDDPGAVDRDPFVPIARDLPVARVGRRSGTDSVRL